MKKLFVIIYFICFIPFSFSQNYSAKEKALFSRNEYRISLKEDAYCGIPLRINKNAYGKFIIADKFLPAEFTYTPNSSWITSVSFKYIGGSTIYDITSNGSAVNIWQDPVTPDNLHAAVIINPANDPSFTNRRTKYYFSSDRGVSWLYAGDVPIIRSGFATISGFSDGSALISNHSTDGGSSFTRSQAYKDAFAGLGSFTRLDAPPVSHTYIWSRVISTTNISLVNKFLMMAGVNGQDTTRINVCTNKDFTPGTWLGWTTIPECEQAETYALARGQDGRIGLLFKNDDNKFPLSYGDIWFTESTNNGTSFGPLVKIFDVDFSTDSLCGLRGVSLVYQGNAPKAVFETIKMTNSGSFFPASPAKIRFWSTSLPGTDPNRSIVIADTNNVGYHPYVGINDVMATLCRPSIGKSSDEAALFVSFMVPSDLTGPNTDPTSYMDIYLTMSINNGNDWNAPEKINPSTPVKDWRYPSVSVTSDREAGYYYVNMLALQDSIPGSYINSGAYESLAKYYFVRVKIPNVLPPLPIAPVLQSPDNNSINVQPNSNFVWRRSQYAVSYHLQASTNAGFPSFVINDSAITDTLKKMIGLDTSRLYYWRVRAKNVAGYGIYSAVWSFTTSNVYPVPNAPQLLSPPNGTLNQPSQITFRWRKAVEPLTEKTGNEEASGKTRAIQKYLLVYSKDSAFSQQVLDSNITDTIKTISGFINDSTYYWKVKAKNEYSWGPFSQTWKFTINTVSASNNQTDIPDKFELYQNYPNPFNPVTKIKFALPVASDAEITVYDITGRIVEEVSFGKISAGYFEYTFDAGNFSSGIFFYRLKAGNYTNIRKMIVLK